MSEDSDEENSLIKYSGNYGGITQESQFWDDFEDIGEQELLKRKIIKIKIYTGKYNDKEAIFGISVTFKNLANGAIEERDHKGSKDFEDVKEFEIGGQFLTDFHIRFTNEAEYISQLGYGTTKTQFLVPEKSDDGEDKTIETNGGENIIVGTFGCLREKLDATGFLYIPKKEYMKISLFCFFMLKYVVKKDAQFKDKWDKQYTSLPKDYQYIWKFANLPDACFFNIIKYCFS